MDAEVDQGVDAWVGTLSRLALGAGIACLAKDQRGMTVPFRYLGPVAPLSHCGERPITVEWQLSAEIPPELFRHWTR